MGENLHVVCPHCHTTNRVARERLADGATCGKCRGALLAGEPFELTAASFDRHVSASELPLVVDFWAPWCGPCRMMARSPAPRARSARRSSRNGSSPMPAGSLPEPGNGVQRERSRPHRVEARTQEPPP
jgi:thiol-disulfide isomerase/thioredoxin